MIINPADIPRGEPTAVLSPDDLLACEQVMEAMQRVMGLLDQCKSCGIDTAAAERETAVVYSRAKAIRESFGPKE